MSQPKFEVAADKSLEVIFKSMMPANGDFVDVQFKMADFLLDLGYGSKRLFCPF